jgi:YbgC/YbaW family acyl-CoA thioester hydrolase
MNKRPRTSLTVRFSDCDPFGHLYNVRYLDYMFDGREQHVAESYPMLFEEMKSRRRNWVVVSTDIRYLHPAAHGEAVDIESCLFNVSRHGVALEIAMLDPATSRLKAVLWSALRYVDLERGAIAQHAPDVQRFLDEAGCVMAQASLDERVKALVQAASAASAPRPMREA